MTRKKLRLLALLAIGMLAWLVPIAVQASIIPAGTPYVTVTYDAAQSSSVGLRIHLTGGNLYKVVGGHEEQLPSPIPGSNDVYDISLTQGKGEFRIYGAISRFDIFDGHGTNGIDYIRTLSAEKCDLKERLYVRYCRNLEEVKVSQSPSFEELVLQDISNHVSLKVIDCPKFKTINYWDNSPKIKSLELENTPLFENVNDDSNLQIVKLNKCPKVKKIIGANVYSITAINCPNLATIAIGTKLQNLTLENCSVATLPTSTFLTDVDVKDCANVTKIEARGCANLGNLKVKNCSSLTNIDVANSGTNSCYLIVENCSSLKRIDNIDKVSLTNIEDCANLEALDYEKATHLYSCTIKNCGKLEKINGKGLLRKFTASNCSKLATLEGMSGLETLDLLKCAVTKVTAGNSLQWVKAKDCDKLATVEAKNASQLTSIALSNCSGVTLTASNCAKLSSLDISHCVRNLTVENCGALSSLNGGTNLRNLEVNNCANLSSLTANGNSLESLTLNDCGKISTLANVSKSSLRSLSVKSCGKITDIVFPSNSNIETIVATSCTGLNKLDVQISKKLKTVEANPCKEVDAEGCSELTALKVGNSLQKLKTSECKKLTKVEGSLSALTTFTCTRAGFTSDFLREVFEGTKTPNLQTFEGYELNLPSKLVVKSSTLKKLDLFRSKNLTSFAVQGTSVLEELELRETETLKDLDVLQAKNLKKLIIGSTGVKRISLEGLKKLEYVSMPGGYPARLLQELICQLKNRVNINAGEFKYFFSTNEKKLVNGKVAKDKNWKIININESGKDITSECTATVSCDEVVPPTTTDEVHFELTGSTKLFFTTVKPTMVWLSATSNKNDFYYNDYYVAGNSSIDLNEHDHVYLFTQPNALSEIKIESAGNVKGIELTSVPDLKTLTLKEAGKLQSLNITKQTALTSLIVTKAKDLSSLDISKNTKLTNLEVTKCGLTGSLDLSSHNALTYADLEENKITSIKLGKALTYFRIPKNQLTTLDVSPAVNMTKLVVYDNKLTEITLADNKSKYEHIDLDENGLVALDVQNAINLEHLFVSENQNLSDLNVRGCARLKTLNLYGCKAFKEIQKPGEDAWFLDGCNALRKLKAHRTGLNATELTKLYCKLPQLSANAGELSVVDKSDADNLKEAQKSGTKIAVDKGWKVQDKNGVSFEGDKNRTCDDLKPHDVPVIELVADAGQTTVKFTTSAKELWIEDASGSFEYVDVTPGQEITRVFKPLFPSSYKFHSKITSFDISNQDKVKSLKIEKHDVLTELKASNCTGMVNVQLSNIVNLAKLDINNSHVKELALATFPALRELNCAKNELKQLNFTANTLLEKVDCSENAGLKTITALKSVGSAPAPLKELKCGGSGLSIEAFNQLFCLLPERTSDAKGKLFAVKDATEANEKLVPDNCYTSRATKKHWEILLNDGSTASVGNEASGDHACAPEKVKSIKMDPIAIEHHATLQLQPTIEPSYADNPNVKWTIKAGADKVKLYEGTVTILEALNVGTATLECVALDGGGAKTEVKVTVLEKQVKTITIKSSIPTPFHIGDKVQFTAEIAPADATYRDITWSVDGAAATIDATTGFLVAKTASTSLIVTAKNNSPEHQKTENYKVQINAPDVKGLKLSQNELVIKKDGKKYPVNVTLDPPSAHFNGTIKVTPADPVIAVTCTPQYDEYGFIIQPFKIEVEGITEGRETTVMIQPSAFPTLSATLKVKVVTDFVEPTDMELPATLTAIVGTSTKLEAKVLPETASNRAVLWSLKDAQSAEILSIDVEGNITPLKGGRATVVATAAGKTDLTKECIVDVSVDAIPSHVKLVTTLTVAKNEEIQLQVAGSGESYIKAESNVLQYTLTDAYTTVKVKSASGTIEVYGSLTKLEAKDAADKLTAITFTNDARLTELNVSGNSISELDLSALIDLQKLNCANNKLTRLNVIRLTNLTELNCGHNTISELDLIANANLEKLSCEALGLNILNLTTNARLKELVCYGNKFATAMYDEIYCTLPTTGGVMIPAKAKVAAGSDPNYDAMVASSSQLATQKSWKVIYEDQSDIQTTGTKTACESKPATGITIEPLSVKIGETKPIKYGLQPAGSTSLVSFRSQDETIATVDDKGNVKGVKAGTVDILITTDVPTVNGTCKVTVEEGKIELTGIAIEPLSVEIGKTKQIKYTLQPEGATANVTFKSQDETIATVDAQGNVTGVKEGTVKIDVTTDVADVKGTCDVTVTGAAIVPTGITIEPLSVKVGGTKQIKYTLQPEGATAKVTFKSQDETIATVDAQGNVKGVKVGKVKIDVTTDVDGVKGTCDVTVEKANAVEDAIFANVRVMPNPFSTNMRIVLDGDLHDMKYELINVTGSVVRSGNIVSSETQIETSELMSGIYLLRLTTDTGFAKSYRLVKE